MDRAKTPEEHSPPASGHSAPPDIREALRERDELYRLIFNQAGDAIELVDAETLHFIEVNDTACRLLGYTREELVGRSLMEIQVDLDETTIRANLQGWVKKHGRVRIDNRHRCKDGRILDVQVGIQLAQLDGRPCFVAVWHDTSVEKTAQLALINEAEWRRALIEHSRDGVAIFNAEHRLIEANARFAELLGYSHTELLTLHSWDVDADLTEADICAGFADPLSVNQLILTRHRRKDGSLYDAEVSIQGAQINGRNVFISTTRDVSERKRAARALRESEERYRSLVEGSPDIVYSFSDKRGGLFWSIQVEVVFGYRLADLQADPFLWSRLIHPDDQPRIQTALRAFEQGTPFDLEYRIRTRSGAWRWLRDRSIQRRVLDDEVIVDGLASDITERKQTEQALLEAKLAAEAATLAKSDFLAHMSHELRTPLNAVIGLTQVLEQAELPPEQCALVQHIRLAGHTMLQISNDILDLAKIEANQIAIEVRPCQLATVLKRIEAIQGDAARGKGLTLAIVPPPEFVGQVLTDPLRLEQILTNLVSNAIKFTEQGTVRLWIEPLSLTAEHACLLFAVQDSGIGIAPETQAHLFTPFTQADASIARRYGGTGLGLSISKRLVELMGGTIGVESHAGEGSLFWFELTLARTAPTAPTEIAETAAPTAPVQRPRGMRLGGLRVLTVDDNRLNLDVVAQLLRLEGAHATTALHGAEALELLRRDAHAFDVVLMDVQMPVLDGLRATLAIRHELGLQDLPVIALSAGVLRDEQQRTREAGCNDFLAKPVELEALVAILERWAGQAITAPACPLASAQISDSATVTAALLHIPGIDPNRLQQLTQGDLGLARRLLCRFLTDIGDLPRLIAADLSNGALMSAAARLHGLRGAAANLGALELAELAGVLEAALKAENAVDPALLTAHSTQLRACFEQLRQTLTAYLGEASVLSTVPSLADSTQVDSDKLQQLRAALSANRPQAARRLFTELEAELLAVYGEQTTQTLAVALEGLQFTEALAMLETVRDIRQD
ncbi:PAS domain S-box-containing protein [Allochromatium warmingii]|uniref:histidine kinase n=1 Tax=Allochromatium warmingii TaxID=61595 RepID=A0A1H3GIM2_ALLWA|nr:PAS domain S-box protein [Allochromatium warmingii]SDY03153.1 PAS domain S-box-containing protein [Allochromatium warmingii]